MTYGDKEFFLVFLVLLFLAFLFFIFDSFTKSRQEKKFMKWLKENRKDLYNIEVSNDPLKKTRAYKFQRSIIKGVFLNKKLHKKLNELKD